MAMQTGTPPSDTAHGEDTRQAGERPSTGEARADGDFQQSTNSGPNGSQTESEGEKKPDTSAPAQPSGKAEEKKPSKIKQWWKKAELDAMTLSMMLKGSIPPIVALAMYQAGVIAQQYQTLGYLVAITSILGFCIMPRGKFIQTMSLNILAICIASAVQLLALYCATQARLHTSSPPTSGASQSSTVPYNSSASSVCAIWLFFQTWLINTIRAARPQYQFPCIIYTIFLDVSLTYGVMFPNMASAISFMERLMKAFLTGFALATATHFLVFPTSSRKVVFKMMAGYVQLLNGMIKTQMAYMASLEEVDPIQLRKKHEQEAEEQAKKSKGKKSKAPEGLYSNAVSLKLREMLGKLTELHSKLHGDITPAKREIAIGKLESHDITQLWSLMRLVFVPVMGLSSIMTIFERQAELRGWGRDDLDEEDESARVRQLHNLHVLMKTLHEPFQQMAANLDGAFNHILLTLEFVPRPKKTADVESQSSEGPAPPGSPGFAAAYKQRLDDFYNSKQRTLQEWCREHGIDLPDDFFTSSSPPPEDLSCSADEHVRERDQRTLFLTLYLEYLLYRVGRAVLNLVLFVDKRHAEGAFARSKIIFPGSRTLYDWLRSVVGREDMSQEDFHTADMDMGVSQSVYLGQEFAKRKDPEHEAPRNTGERVGEAIRQIPIFFRSDASAFGLRAAAATLSIAIICYLRQSQSFFLHHRLLWAMIMVAISMTRTAGQSIFNFALRIGGTAVAMLGSFAIWYIAVGNAGGVLVLLWLWIFAAFYVVLKMPKFIIVAILSLVTCVLTVGYELQVRMIGVQASESTGQPVYPMYILAPYRLATVTGGIFIAFVWTIFPYPISETSELRKDLGAALYLTGLYHHLGHESIKSALQHTSGDRGVAGTHASHLDAARRTVFSKLVFLLNDLGANSAFSRFQIPIGGRFPRKEYESLIACLKRLLLWVTLANYTAVAFEGDGATSPADSSEWSRDFRHLLTTTSPSTHRITTLLAVLSSSLRNAAPLPPHLELPEPFAFARRLRQLDPRVLSARHLAEPEYAAFAVMQVVGGNIVADVGECVRHVKTLVGEIDFSFRAVQPSSIDSDIGSFASEDGKKDEAA